MKQVIDSEGCVHRFATAGIVPRTGLCCLHLNNPSSFTKVAAFRQAKVAMRFDVLIDGASVMVG